MSHTGTTLALCDILVHFITLRNNYLGPGTTSVCSRVGKPRPGRYPGGVAVRQLWTYVRKLRGIPTQPWRTCSRIYRVYTYLILRLSFKFYLIISKLVVTLILKSLYTPLQYLDRFNGFSCIDCVASMVSAAMVSAAMAVTL